ncbi:hypothetical protein BJ322DRAFT_1025308 [Thelephora terrestris]|uniref:Uncharacterized protein n=1 Tax=Thelephora terrestris TaxID=56493 RepID=A0A9P6L1M8_9AGAM|nr:hypothetical protein BJ322DRAFT_1025308 [Thelephora terrestris]
MSFPNNHTYKVANGISTISRIDRRAANRKTYASEAGVPYTTDDQILEVVKQVDAEHLRETIPHLMGLTWDDELWVRSMIAEKVIFQMRGRFGELEHPIKKELWYTLQRGIYDQDLLEHRATVPRAVRHATASTTLLWSLIREGESRVERLEREVKEAKADVLRLSAEGLQLKETLAAFQQGTNEALEAMVANHQELIAGLKVRDNNIKGALARRDEKTEQLEDVVAVLTAQVASLQDKTCNCKEGPKLVGQGTADVPFELEYAYEVVLPSPNPSSYATPPIENAVPVPTPAPASTLAESNKENCGRCPLQPISQLVKIEDEVMQVDRAEDVPRAIEGSVANALDAVLLIAWLHRLTLTRVQLSRMVTSLIEVGDESSAIGSTVPTDRSSRRSSFDTSVDSQYRIPPRGPTRETEGCLPTTSIVLSSSHPVMEMWDQVFQSSVTSGRLIGPLEGISSYRLELVVQLSAEDGDAMFGEVLARRGQHYDLRDGRLMTMRPAFHNCLFGREAIAPVLNIIKLGATYIDYSRMRLLVKDLVELHFENYSYPHTSDAPEAILDLLRASPRLQVLTLVGLNTEFVSWPGPVELQHLRQLEFRGSPQDTLKILSLLRLPGLEVLLLGECPSAESVTMPLHSIANFTMGIMIALFKDPGNRLWHWRAASANCGNIFPILVDNPEILPNLQYLIVKGSIFCECYPFSAILASRPDVMLFVEGGLTQDGCPGEWAETCSQAPLCIFIVETWWLDQAPTAQWRENSGIGAWTELVN